MNKTAIISDCNKYRYELHRTWDKDKGKVLFIMLNPSTACGVSDDLTTIRCMNFAKKWGYGGLMIGNIYPFRAKRPKDLAKWSNNCGNKEYKALFENMDYVTDMFHKADLIVCAWGCNHKGMPDWIDNLKDYKALHYLELCDDGVTPKHPLGNLSKDVLPKRHKLNTIIDG
jgi:hypothetical protein